MELSEEEKKSIEYIKEFKNEVFEGVGNKSIMAKNIDILLNIFNKQQKEIKDWFEIADNILRATNDYGNITIGDIPKYIENQQKEIKKEKSRIMELAELLDKQENEIKSLEQELEIQEGCSISKDKIREIINKYINVQGLDNGPLKDMVNELL